MFTEKLVELGYKFEDGKLFEVTKSGRLIPKKLTTLQEKLKLEFTDFCRWYAQQYPLSVRFAYGNDIHDIFENYRPRSCMGHKSKRDLREVYANNPKQVCVVYGSPDDHPLYTSPWSALVWLGKEKAYVDRFYNGGWAYAGIIDDIYAAIANQLGKEVAPLRSGTTKYPLFNKTVTFKLRHSEDEPLPYMDTINTIVDYGSDYVKLSNHGSGGVCQDTNGTVPNGENGYRCSSCGCRCCEDEMRITEYGDIYCDDCYNEAFCYVEVRINGRWVSGDYSWDDVCQIDGECYPKDYCVELPNGDWALKAHAVELHNGDYALYDDAVELHNGDYALYDDAVELHNGDYALADDAVELHNGDYALYDDAVELHNGDYALRDDAVELHNGDYALMDDAVELHNGDYALMDDAVELSDYVYNAGKYALKTDCVILCDCAYIVDDVRFFNIPILV